MNEFLNNNEWMKAAYCFPGQLCIKVQKAIEMMEHPLRLNILESFFVCFHNILFTKQH